MCETTETTAPPGGGEAAPEPAPAETTAPVEQGGEATEQQPKPSYAERRISVLSARLAAQSAELEAAAAGLPAAADQHQQQWPQTPEELERIVDARAEAKAAAVAAQTRAQAFHEQGRANYADWTERCQSLMAMGADAPFSQLLVEMPDGARVAAALADNPEELERIASLRTERARAIELGKFAAKAVEATPAAAPRRPVSRAPAPIRPLGSGTANPVFNEYTADDASALAAALHAGEPAEARQGLALIPTPPSRPVYAAVSCLQPSRPVYAAVATPTACVAVAWTFRGRRKPTPQDRASREGPCISLCREGSRPWQPMPPIPSSRPIC